MCVVYILSQLVEMMKYRGVSENSIELVEMRTIVLRWLLGASNLCLFKHAELLWVHFKDEVVLHVCKWK